MSLRVASAHVSPIFLSARATTDKCLRLITQSAAQSTDLLVFPESFIPAFPHWSALRAPCTNHSLFHLMHAESLLSSGPELASIRHAARQHRVAISLGFSERAEGRTGTLWNSNVIISDAGEVLVHHRKLVPTFFEKLTWAPGDGHGLRVAETKWGKVGALICGENTNPLARYALMAQGEQVHISTWPAVWPTRFSGVKDEVQGEGQGKNYDNVAANRIRAAAHCFEAKCFGVLSAGVLGQDAIDAVLEGAGEAEMVRTTLEEAPRGASMFLDPTGAVIPGWVVGADGKREMKEHLQHEEGVLYCDMDLSKTVEGKQYHDVVGGYQRFDVFQVNVDRTRREPVTFSEQVATLPQQPGGDTSGLDSLEIKPRSSDTR
ncbi:Carbon-nitrogen hydrolase-like protein 2 [Elsinoe fawcettii]|nr:Carbon-nitrogen hydrolase-like protein 2 [Elsinoe fawcettii]